MKPLPETANRPDYPRLVKNAIAELDRRVTAAGTGGTVTLLELDGGTASTTGTPAYEIDGGSA